MFGSGEGPADKGDETMKTRTTNEHGVTIERDGETGASRVVADERTEERRLRRTADALDRIGSLIREERRTDPLARAYAAQADRYHARARELRARAGEEDAR